MIKRLLTHLEQMDPRAATLWGAGIILIIGLVSLPVAVAFSWYSLRLGQAILKRKMFRESQR